MAKITVKEHRFKVLKEVLEALENANTPIDDVGMGEAHSIVKDMITDATPVSEPVDYRAIFQGLDRGGRG